MMDNINRVYKARFMTAREHAQRGEYNRCLEIPWDLRLKPHLCFYRRAMVNVLIAMVADPKKHPDLKNLAQGAIDLVAQIRREGLYEDTAIEEGHLIIERNAKHGLECLVSARAPVKSFPQSAVLGAGSLITPSPEPTTQPEVNEEDAGAEKPWKIEGMFTDYGSGPAAATRLFSDTQLEAMNEGRTSEAEPAVEAGQGDVAGTSTGNEKQKGQSIVAGTPYTPQATTQGNASMMTPPSSTDA